MQFKYDNALVGREDIIASSERLAPYVKYMLEQVASRNFDAPEASLCLLDATDTAERVRKIGTEKIGPKLKFVFLCGIGGSNLGAKAIYDSMFMYADMFHARERLPAEERVPQMLFIDTVNPILAQEATTLIDSQVESPEEALVVIATKSGTTTETVVNAEMILEALIHKFGHGPAVERAVAITDEGSALAKSAENLGMSIMPIPRRVGGRYSVFSAAGMFPLHAVGFDLNLIRERAKEMQLRCLSTDPDENPAMVSASIIWNLHKNGKSIHDLFVFDPQLESLGKWYRQLMGESLGKRENIEFELVHEGITPTVTVGSTDLHSVFQLYAGGPKDKMTTFVTIASGDSRKVPDSQTLMLNPVVSGKSSQDVLDAIYGGVKKTYAKEFMPFMEVTLSDNHDVPAFMQFKMIEMMLLGRLMNVDPFNQPSVELYKAETKKLLEGA